MTWRSLVVLCIASGMLTACLSSNSDVSGFRELGVAAQAQALELERSCNDSSDSVYGQPSGAASMDMDMDMDMDMENRRRGDVRGDVVRCAPGRTIGTAELRAALSERGYANVSVRSAVRLYRISYRTQRAGRRADVASALVALPTRMGMGMGMGMGDKYRRDLPSASGSVYALRSVRQRGSEEEDESERGPLIVYGHGTVPYGQSCAYSRSDPLQATIAGAPDLELTTVVALAAQGWPVIMPDYAGFVAGSPVTGYMFAEDEAYALLDATRAMRKLLDDAPQKVVLVGHSQGGHGVLAAQSYAHEYGLSGTLSGVVAFAPFWAPARLFGLIIAPGAYSTTDQLGAYVINTGIEYFYTHAELIEGSGAGKTIFNRDAVSDQAIDGLVSSCDFFPSFSALGDTTDQFMSIDLLSAVPACANAGIGCDNPIASKWLERFVADRPQLDARGAPVVMWQGAADEVVPVSIAGCAIDRIRADLSAPGATASFQLCADRDADHELVESRDAGWVIQWIKARTQGGQEPPACAGAEALGEGLGCAAGELGNADSP